jgi:hypothetical protein
MILFIPPNSLKRDNVALDILMGKWTDNQRAEDVMSLSSQVQLLETARNCEEGKTGWPMMR